jgi:hypothetical protein
MRDYHCVKYSDCLDEAAKLDLNLNCNRCAKEGKSESTLGAKHGKMIHSMIDIEKTTKAANLILEEYKRAFSSNPSFNSSHEGYAVIKEELDELWDEIKKHRSTRSKDTMRTEAVQVGAMALRFIVDICMGEEPLR